MRMMTKSILLSLGVILVMTVSVLGVGMIIIDDILYKFQERVLRLELTNASQVILQKLNRSGMRAAAQAAADLQEHLRQAEDLKTVRLFVVEAPDNRVVYHPGFSAGDSLSYDFVDRMFSGRDGAIEYVLNGASYYAVFTTVHPLNWLIGIAITKMDMLGRKTDFLWAIGGITFFVLGLNTLMLSFFWRPLLKRIRMALDCVNRIRKGDLSARIPAVAGGDEVGSLLEGINAMSARIQQRTVEQQDTEEALRESRELLQSIIDNSTAVIFVKDLEGRYLLINQRYAELFHVSQDVVVGRTDHDVFPAGMADAFRAADQQVLAARAAMRIEEVAPQDDGLHNYISLKYPLWDAAGEPYAICGIATDISEQKRIEQTLRLAKEHAEIASRTKSEFLANMSHELRTPLNAVIGFSEAILSRVFGETLSPRHASYVQDIHASGMHLLDIINDVLDVSAIEAGKLELHVEEIDTRGLIEAAEHIINPRAEKKRLRLRFDMAHAPTRLRVDERRMKQVLINLLGNAVKFTPDDGSVALTIAGAEDGGVRIIVADNGIGMDDAGIASALTIFGQVDSALSRQHEGTGLGLPLSQRLAEAHGGRLDIESGLGKGTTVTVYLPALCVITSHGCVTSHECVTSHGAPSTESGHSPAPRAPGDHHDTNLGLRVTVARSR